MQIVQRIMNKLVGEEISAEQLEEIAGGVKDSCEHSTNTWSGGEYYSGTWMGCDD